MTVTLGTPLIVAGGVTATATAATPHQPAEGFGNVDDAIHWRQAQLWLDRGFDTAQPRAGTAFVRRADDAVELFDLDASLRVARSGNTGAGAAISWNESVQSWKALDDRVVAVLDGLGARLSATPNAAGANAAGGAMLAMRGGSPPHVTVDGADAAGAADDIAETMAAGGDDVAEAVAHASGGMPKGVKIGLAAGGAAAAAIAGYVALQHFND